MSTGQTHLVTVDEFLAEACARNTPAELHFDASNGARLVARVRFMDLMPGRILTDAPATRDTDGPVPTDTPVTVHFRLNGGRWQFDSLIEQSAIDVQLNKREMVRGLALRKPQKLTDSQRREDFRVSVASRDPISVALVRCRPDLGDACSVDGPRWTARIVDLSAGGTAVVMHRRSLGAVKRSQRFYLTFDLPGVDSAFCMVGSVRHTRELHEGESIRIAFAFRDWTTATLKPDQLRIARFVAEHQRAMIRRRK